MKLLEVVGRLLDFVYNGGAGPRRLPCGSGTLCKYATMKNHVVNILLAEGDSLVEEANRLLSLTWSPPGAGARLGPSEARRLREALLEYVAYSYECDTLAKLLEIPGIGVSRATEILFVLNPESNYIINKPVITGLKKLIDAGLLEPSEETENLLSREPEQVLEELRKDLTRGDEEERCSLYNEFEDLLSDAASTLSPLIDYAIPYDRYSLQNLGLDAILYMLGKGDLSAEDLKQALAEATGVASLGRVLASSLSSDL